jgi:hypothetical protein
MTDSELIAALDSASEELEKRLQNGRYCRNGDDYHTMWQYLNVLDNLIYILESFREFGGYQDMSE